MAIGKIQPGEPLGATRGQAIVCIPVFGALDLFTACLRSVLRATPTNVPILIADDATPGPEIREFLLGLRDQADLAHDIIYFIQPLNLGFVGNVNAAFESAAPGDVVILNSDCEVAPGWLDGLRAAAYSDDTVATATSLTNNGTIVSVPERNRPRPDLPEGWTLEAAADAIRGASLRLRPRIPTAIGHCVYIRRSALDLVGGFDPRLAPGYGEEVDFSQRCVQRGLCHVVADDVFVFHRGGGSFQARPEWSGIKEAHDRLIASRYPYYQRNVVEAAETTSGPLVQALAVARRALTGLSVTVDASCLGPDVTGTPLHALELIHALWRTRRIRLRVAVPRNLGGYARDALARMPGLELITWEDVNARTRSTDVVHRSYQITNPHELRVLARMGERVVITHQDLIAYRNPSYFDRAEGWMRYRQVTRQGLAGADTVLFFSNHAAKEAIDEQLVEPGRSRVVYIGIDHQVFGSSVTPTAPARSRELEGVELLLCLGTDFRHKNRVFALRILEALQARHGFEGKLVFAGPRVSAGSSVLEEEAFASARPAVAAATVDLMGVSEAEKSWLLGHSRLVVYPTIHEGFGLIPFEAARAGVPCLFASQTSLAEILPAEAALLVRWDPALSADRAMTLLRDEDARHANVEAILRAGERFRWETTAGELIAAYEATTTAMPRPSETDTGILVDGTGPLAMTRFAARRALWLWRTYGVVEGSKRAARGVGRRIRWRLPSGPASRSEKTPSP